MRIRSSTVTFFYLCGTVFSQSAISAEAAPAKLSDAHVHVDIFEDLNATGSWDFSWPAPTESYRQSDFAFVGFPNKYTSTGVRGDRSNPFAIRARAVLHVKDGQAGAHQFILRSMNAARLSINGTEVATNGFMIANANGHESVPDWDGRQHLDVRPLPPACQQDQCVVELPTGDHVVQLDLIVGGKRLRPELNEVCIYVARPGNSFTLLTANGAPPIAASEVGWNQVLANARNMLTRVNDRRRRERAEEWSNFWTRRHVLARQAISNLQAIAVPSPTSAGGNEIDRFINHELVTQNITPSPLTSDVQFLRRVTLDTCGVVPSRAELQTFLAAPPDLRRAAAIERLLNDPRWADHWVGYWQDVLAENPGILKPKLNNTGPFRWWIYDSFRDNKPMDRFATELVLMEGSKYYGGPAGFEMASQNDVPLAAKAHVLSTAFLGIEMKCARCHDAPYHPFKQEQLFNVAAMLHRDELKLPESSTVPGLDSSGASVVEASLKPGSRITPSWPFPNIIDEELLESLMRDPTDSRERLAALLTSPRNERFAKVLVNRMWHRYLGRGLVEPVDDWHASDVAAHPELLDYLARRFVASGYDWKELARLILSSHAYQRQVQNTANPSLFAAPQRRRMTAEQLVDSLFSVSGKNMRSEPLTLDPEGRRPVEAFLNLGRPSRAWQFTSLSNERDRPALALPMAQSIVDLLVSYGWRDARPNPLTTRDEAPTMLQPLVLANGVVGRRAVTLSDDSRFTELCLQDVSPSELLTAVWQEVLTRAPTGRELRRFTEHIAEGYQTRVYRDAATVPPMPELRTAVSWSNHLSAEATKLKQELERAVHAGDRPTQRLHSGWRERMEDVLWALFNSPEFVFVP